MAFCTPPRPARAGDACSSLPAVETVSRFGKGNSDSWLDTKNPRFDEAQEVASAAARTGADEWHDPRADGNLPDVW